MPLTVAAGPDDLAPEARALLRAMLAARPGALCCDLDGTLAPIAPTAAAARLLPGAADLLTRARGTFAVVALVSGRDLASLWRVARVPGIRYIGDHGNAAWTAPDDRAARPPRRRLDARVAATLADFAQTPLAQATPGLAVERKGATAAIHYRAAPQPDATRAAVLAALAPLAAAHRVRVAEGKMVIELQAPDARTKGDAIRDLATTAGLRGLVYFGDDRTDIAAFQAARDLRAAGHCRAVAVAVAHAEAPPELFAAADVALAGPDAVLAIIAWLLEGAP